MKFKLFSSVLLFCLLASSIFYFSACQKEATSTETQTEVKQSVETSVTERGGPIPCPNCAGTLNLSIANTTPGLTYSFRATIETRPCSFSPWTIVSTHNINPYPALGGSIILPFTVKQDNYYRIKVRNTCAQPIEFASSITTPTNNVMVANAGTLPPGQILPVVVDYYSNLDGSLGRGRCGCVLEIGCQ